jgi:ABC-type multidrug transport system fused ATPase/permease subunit
VGKVSTPANSAQRQRNFSDGRALSTERWIKKASREVRKKEGEIISVIEEVLSSIRVVKAFAREDYERRRLEEESLESVEIGLRARGLKAKLSPLDEIIAAIGTCHPALVDNLESI